jgi:hypothetical protein
MRMRAQTHIHTERERHTRKCLTVASLPNPHCISLLLQIKAWKAGHKGKCAAAARAGTTAAKPAADQKRVLKMLAQLAAAKHVGEDRSQVVQAVLEHEAGWRRTCGEDGKSIWTRPNPTADARVEDARAA